MEAAHAWAAENGYEECILHSQTPVLRFYQTLGYIAEGEEFYEADIPHYKMRKRLNGPPKEAKSMNDVGSDARAGGHRVDSL
jgi:hypothetical protein